MATDQPAHPENLTEKTSDSVRTQAEPIAEAPSSNENKKTSESWWSKITTSYDKHKPQIYLFMGLTFGFFSGAEEEKRKLDRLHNAHRSYLTSELYKTKAQLKATEAQLEAIRKERKD